MIVVGIDPHKRSHTAVALEEASGASVGERTVSADASGRGELLAWAAALGGACRFAIEDGRPFSGALERSLLAGGYDVVRVPPKLMGQARRSGRTYGKSDPIDARAVALAAIREPDLPRARIDPADEQLRLLVEHRNDLVGERTRMHNRLRDHLHQLEIGLEVPPGGLERPVWLKRVRTALEALGPSVRRRIALELVERCAELTGAVRGPRRRARDPGVGPSGRCGPDRDRGVRCAERRHGTRRRRRHRALRHGGPVRLPRRGGTATGILGGEDPAPPEPARQPTAERGPAPHRLHPGPDVRTRQGLPGAQAHGRQDPQGGPAVPPATPRQGGLPNPRHLFGAADLT